MKLGLRKLTATLVITVATFFILLTVCPQIFMVACKSGNREVWKVILFLGVLLFIILLVINILIKLAIRIFKKAF
jgi:hypothetical protein